jgi:small basic protein
MSPPAPGDSVDLVYTELRAKLEQHFENIRALANKAGNIATFTGVTLGLVVASGAPSKSRAIWAIAVAALTASVIATLVALWVYNWRADPEPAGLRDYIDKPEPETKRQLIANLTESYEFNAHRAVTMHTLLRVGIASLVLGWVMVFAYLMSLLA